MWCVVVGTVVVSAALTACAVPNEPPTSTTTTSIVHISGPPALSRKSVPFVCNAAGPAASWTWTLRSRPFPPGPRVQGFAAADAPTPTIHIESVVASWTETPPAFSTDTLGDSEEAVTQPVSLPPGSWPTLTVTYSVVDTGATGTLVSPS